MPAGDAQRAWFPFDPASLPFARSMSSTKNSSSGWNKIGIDMERKTTRKETHAKGCIQDAATESPLRPVRQNGQTDQDGLLRKLDLRRRAQVCPLFVRAEQLPPEPQPVHPLCIPPQRGTRRGLEELREVPDIMRDGDVRLVRNQRVQFRETPEPTPV